MDNLLRIEKLQADIKESQFLIRHSGVSNAVKSIHRKSIKNNQQEIQQLQNGSYSTQKSRNC